MYLQVKDKMNLQKITIMFCSPLDPNYHLQYLVPSKIQYFWMSEWMNEAWISVLLLIVHPVQGISDPLIPHTWGNNYPDYLSYDLKSHGH